MDEVTVTAEDFKAYVKVQQSGVTNMFMVGLVTELSGLDKKQVLNIMENYGTYEKKYL